MAKNVYRNIEKNYRTNGSTYGGFIFNGDFDTRYPSGNIARRIAADLKFDEQCKRNSLWRNKSHKKG